MSSISISIIISSYNSEKCILNTLESVYNQTYSDWECIIVDDGSTDSTVQIINEYIKNKNKYTLIANKQNTGRQPVVLNQGIKLAKFDYVLILDSDDLLKDTCLGFRIEKMNKDLEMNIFPNFCIFNEKIDDRGSMKNIYNHKNPNYLHDFIIHKLPTAWQITSIIWKKDALKKIGFFNENMMRIVDVEISCRALIYDLTFHVFYDEEIDYYYRVTSSTNSVKIKRMKFYKASTIFIKEVFNFTKNKRIEKIDFVEECLKKFYLSVLTTVLISKDFDKNHLKDYIDFGINEGLIFDGLLTKNVFQLKKITELPLIRNFIFHFTKFYLNK
jgi:glycosyltransferase involved in cell wall biosynthesis